MKYMKKVWIYFLILLFLIISVYLKLSYAYFYNFLSQHNLSAPVYETTMLVSNQLNNQTIKYMALGDSLTAGVGVSDYKSSYPYLIAQKLSGKFNVELANLAHVGDTSSDVLVKLPKVLSQKPDFITLLIGVNDIHNLKSLKEFENNYLQIVSVLKKSGARIYLLSIPYLGSDKITFFPYNFLLDFRTKQFNEIIQKISVAEGLKYIDLYHLKQDANFYSSDEFHPQEQGYKEWSGAINVD